MRHTCQDGTQSKLQRHGPVGTIEGVTFSCGHCGYVKSAVAIERDTERVHELIVHKLSRFER